MAQGKFVTPKPFVGGLKDIFLSFGYEPTEAELQQFASVPGGRGGHERALSAVGSYVNALKTEEDRKANDPLKKFSEDQTARSESMGAESKDLFGQLTNLYRTAPQLFGALSPDQIASYIAPLKTQFDQSLGETEGAFARRGLTGSNIEGSAITDAARQFNENVLSTGLNIGMTQQDALAKALSGRSDLLFQGAENANSRLGGAAGQMSSQDAESSQFLASLPAYLRQLALQEQQVRNAMSKKSNPWGTVGSLLGGGVGAFFGGPVGFGIGSSLGGGIGNLAGGGSDATSNAMISQVPYWMMAAKGGSSSSPLLNPESSRSYYNPSSGGGTLLPPSLSLNAPFN